MQSMTGFGKSICELPDKVLTIEIKSLNSKQLDIYVRIPSYYKEKEVDIRNTLAQQLNRGKIEITITQEVSESSPPSQINKPVVKAYFNQLTDIRNELGINENNLLQILTRFPDVLKTEKEELTKQEWEQVNNGIQEAINSIIDFRNQEGSALKKDILKRVISIELYLDKITPFEKERINDIKNRIGNNLSDNFDQEKIDQNRFEQEVIYYLEKLDITEEKVRLKNHCKFFQEVLNNETQAGKKLGFISQEMGREINTIGSKASHSEIQRLVVLMKDELEKIKEQLMNVL